MAPNNPLPVWGNEKTMNLNPLILTNIQSSPYFKVNLYELKTYHEVIDEIYYKVDHLEPWEKGSRKTAGQTGMCGGVRGVGAGGIVSSAFCLLYKLFTLKLTKKQVIGLCTHSDSPYIRGLGYMYIRYTQDPKELWDWYDPYLDDEEEIDVKAGGGHKMMIGEMLRQWLAKLEWYSTLFPRVPVPVQKDIDMKLRARGPMAVKQAEEEEPPPPPPVQPPAHEGPVSFGEAERYARMNRKSPATEVPKRRSPHGRSPVHAPRRSPSRRSPRRSPSRRSPRRSPPRRSPPRRSPVHRAPRRSPSPRHGFDFARELEKEKERQQKEKSKDGSDVDRKRHRSRSRSRDRRRHRSRSKERSKGHKRSRHEDFPRISDHDSHYKSRDNHKSHHRSERERDRERRRSVDRNGDV